ncbi:MAG TPA: TAXI family TRAP transporter solute-binding subunit [Burkholderiales bacterium]
MKLTRSLAFFVFTTLATAASAQTIGIVTTPAGSFSNSAGQAIAKTLVEKGKLRAIVQAQASTGFDEVESGTADFNVSNSFDSTFFAEGSGEYQGQGKHPVMRYVGALIPYRVAMHVRADSSIKTIADLKGKRVSSDFNAQKTIARIIEAHLANAGLSYKDVVKVPAPNVVRQAEDFMSGKVDVMFFALGSPQVKQAHASVGGVRVLEVDTAPDAIKRVQALLPGAYVIQVGPPPPIEGIAKPTQLIAFDMVLITHAKVPDDVVYRVAKALHENKQDLVATFPPFGLFQPQNMAKPLEGVPLHPGAAKYYKEIGLSK